MRFYRDLSIRYKLTLLLMGIVTVVLLVVSVTGVVNQIQFARSSMGAKYATLAKIVAAQSGAALSIADIDRSGVEQVMADLANEPMIRSAALYNADGLEVARYPADAPELPEVPETLGVSFNQAGFIDVVETVKSTGQYTIGKLHVRATTQKLQAEIRRTVVIAIVVFLVALIVAVVMSVVLQRFISVPILELAKLTQRVSTQHDYSLRAEKRGQDELGTLSDNFNSMLAEIRRRDEELSQHRSRLEELVEQRTQVLEARTDELIRSNDELTSSRDALQAANKELEAFSYSVSHDLRAPLRVIDGFSKILMEDYAQSIPQDALNYLTTVRTTTQKMGHLVDDLLNFSRLSRLAIKKQQVDVDQMVHECLDELTTEHKGKTFDVRVSNLPPCLADPSLLRHVWTNLLSNAFKYSGQCQKPVIEIGLRNGGNPGPHTYYVKDNGVGFDMKYAHKLFGVFQRLHKAEDYAGTGVGLAIVQRIVQRHGGGVWAESQQNVGTTFYFTVGEEGAGDDNERS